MEPVVRHPRELQGPAHLKPEAASDHHPGDVVEGVRVAFAELVRPQNRGVVEQRARATRFGCLGEPLGKVRDLARIPGVDLRELLLGGFVRIRLVGKLVLPLVDAEPVHVGLADRVRELQRHDAGEVGRQR